MDSRLGAVESRFADIVWSRAPLSTGELVKLCAQALDWKRTTTYTVLKKLCQRGIFQLDGGTVTARISREDFYAARSQEFVAESFQGSLPAFIAAFTKNRPLSRSEAAQIRRMIDDYTEDD